MGGRTGKSTIAQTGSPTTTTGPGSWGILLCSRVMPTAAMQHDIPDDCIINCGSLHPLLQERVSEAMRKDMT